MLLAICGLAFVVLWVRDRSSSWLLWWGLPLISNGVALTLYLKVGWETDFFAIAFGNAARLFALGCLWYGIRLFQGRQPPWGAISVISLIWIGLCLYPPFIESLAARIAAVSWLTSLLAGLAVRELWIDRADRLRSRMPIMVVFASYGILMLIRGSLAWTAPFPIGAGPRDFMLLGIYSWVVLGHAIFAAILFLSLTMERREAEQRNFAMSDPLTSLLNRRAFGDFAQRMSRRRGGLRDTMAVLVLDLDHFKQVNDRYGHETGDRLLKAFAEVAEDNVRPSDQLFRMGGEEFCFVLPETGVTEALTVAERIRRALEATRVETANGYASTTVSIGIAATQIAIDVDLLLAAADAALYEAKARGRNRVVVAEPAALLREQAEAVTAAPERRRA